MGKSRDHGDKNSESTWTERDWIGQITYLLEQSAKLNAEALGCIHKHERSVPDMDLLAQRCERLAQIVSDANAIVKRLYKHSPGGPPLTAKAV